MIARSLSLLGSLLVYFAVATLIAEAMILGYCWSKGRLDRNKLIQIAAVAQGIDLVALKGEPKPLQEEPSSEQPSYEQIVQARAMTFRNLELREQALKNSLDQWRADQQTLADEKLRYNKQHDQYQSQLAALEKGSENAGLEQTRGILAKLAPKQAKELLLGMLKKDEMTDVVTLLRDMPDGSRAKILKEFKTPEDAEKLDEVLRQLRQGMPEAGIAKQAQEQLKPEKQPKSSGL